jgi:hypothetical protein
MYNFKHGTFTCKAEVPNEIFFCLNTIAVEFYYNFFFIFLYIICIKIKLNRHFYFFVIMYLMLH